MITENNRGHKVRLRTKAAFQRAPFFPGQPRDHPRMSSSLWGASSALSQTSSAALVEIWVHPFQKIRVFGPGQSIDGSLSRTKNFHDLPPSSTQFFSDGFRFIFLSEIFLSFSSRF